MERARVGGAGKKRLAPEDQCKHRQPMAAAVLAQSEQIAAAGGNVEDRRKIDLEKLFRDRARAGEVEPPAGAVGENAPAQLAGRQIVHAPQITKHLRRGRGFFAAPLGAAVERTPPALGLDDRRAQLVTLPFFYEQVGADFCRSVREQQTVGHIFPAAGAEVLLPQARRPSEAFENGPDQIVLGLALVRRPREREPLEDRP